MIFVLRENNLLNNVLSYGEPARKPLRYRKEILNQSWEEIAHV